MVPKFLAVLGDKDPAEVVALGSKVIQNDGHMMLPYWQARISEVTKRKEDLAKEGREVEEVSHIRAEDNLADLGTRGKVKLSELGLHSRWQVGPSFLLFPREPWRLRDLAAINCDKAMTAWPRSGPSHQTTRYSTQRTSPRPRLGDAGLSGSS